jgi:hypothetical protein
VTGAEMAVRAADKVEREINHEGLQATEPQGGTTITIGDKPLIIMTRRSDEWLEVSEVEDTHLGGVRVGGCGASQPVRVWIEARSAFLSCCGGVDPTPIEVC